jgi:hypothetical protein
MGVARSAAGLPASRLKRRGAHPPGVNPNSVSGVDFAETSGADDEQDALGANNIGERKWSKLQTVTFVIVASAALWGAIGYGIFRLLSR